MPQMSRTVSGYDAVALDYDRHLARDRWMRRALWRHFARTFRPAGHLLDLGCGTGIDALYLASIGMRVTAIDASAGMVDRLRTWERSSTSFAAYQDRSTALSRPSPR